MRWISAIMAILASLSPCAAQVSTAPSEPLTVAGVPIYGISENGNLNWYFHQGAHNGTTLWTKAQGTPVGSGWNEGLRVFKGDPTGQDGVIYRVNSQGELYWYKHLGHATGAASWIEGKKVGHGWKDARIAFGAGNGIIYVINSQGDLLWFRHLGFASGEATWENGGIGSKVGVKWGGARFAFSGGEGVIYSIDSKGNLFWYRHEGYQVGTFAWSKAGKPIQVGNGWNEAVSVFSGGQGLIYAMKADGGLYWYNHTGYGTGEGTWTPPGTGNRIGTGWQDLVRIF